MHLRLTPLVLAVVLFAGWPLSPALAYTGVTTLDYGGQLTGYAETTRDWWDPYSGFECHWSEVDPFTGEPYCVAWTEWYNFVHVNNSLWSPSNVSVSGGPPTTDYDVARVTLTPLTPPQYGTWRHDGAYFLYQQVWTFDGYGWQYAEYYTPTGSGQVQVYVPAPSPPPPYISALTPKFGPTDTIVQITGVNFGNESGLVQFNGTSVTSLLSWGPTQIQASVPAGATTGPVVVTTAAAEGGQLSNTDRIFNVTSGSTSSGPVHYYHTDAIGSVRMITDEQGQMVRQCDYLPFGQEWQCTGVGDPRTFAGMEKAPGTGVGVWSALNYVGARYYASGNGRFTTVDPVLDMEQALVEPQRWNRYTYALNNPLKFTDPDGRLPILAIIPIVYGIYEVGSTIYDAYTTYRTFRDPNATTTERAVTGGGLLAGVVLPGGGYGTAGKTVLKHADEIADAVAVVSRTPTDRLIQHLTRSDLVGAAREVVTGVQHGGQHLKEVREAARGLRERIKDINQGLSNPKLTRQRRLELEHELGISSRHLDAAEEALRGRYLQHDIP